MHHAQRGGGWRSMSSIAEALRVNGWASVTIDDGLAHAYKRVVSDANWFFDQPQAIKQAVDIRTGSGHRGWVPSTEAGAYADEGERRYEAFDIGRPPTVDDRTDHPLRGPNQWVDSDEGEAMRLNAEALFDALTELALELGDAICDDLGVERRTLRSLRHEPVSQLRLIHYFDGEEDDGATVAMGAHTDYEFFTFLFQSSPGTQVLDDSGEWIDLEHEACVAILVGDMLEVFSNGRYRSRMHRAATEVQPNRVSIPYFAGADFSAVVAPVVAPVDGDDKTPVEFGTHLMTQLRRDFPYLRGTVEDAEIDLRGAPLSTFEQAAIDRVQQTSSPSTP